MKKALTIIVVSLCMLFFYSCTEDPLPPVITTNTVTEIGASSALSGGAINSDGGAPVTSKGVCWSTKENPTIADHKTTETTSATSFNSELVQLLPMTKYYVRAYAINAVGTGYGKAVSFTTLGNKPGANATNATSIQTTTSTINGSVNPSLLPTTVEFEWGTSSSYGNTVSAAQSPVTGNTPVNISANLTELSPGTTYHFRIKAENSLGITYSNEITFRTLGEIPTVQINEASNISITSAVLNGSVNPNQFSTTVSFEWGTSSSYGNTVSASQSPVSGYTPVNISANLTELSPGTTYHLRIKAENSLGITYSNEITFKTLGEIPTVQINNASNIGISSAILNGSVNSNYLQTTVTFEWGASSSYGNTIPAPQSPVTGNTPVNLTANLSDLSPGTTYHFRIKAENSLGITYSNEIAFKTLGEIPTVQINNASDIDISSAILNGSVNPNNLQTIVIFEWGTSSSYGNTASAPQSPITGNTPGNISASLTDLSPGKTYHYRIKAENSLGITLSVDKTFKTLGDVPSAELKPASNLQYNSASINGRVNPNHLSSTVVFEWGETTLYGNSAPVSLSPVTGDQFVDISADITGLNQGSTYHFRIRAENELGATYSNDLTFTTLAPITDYEGNTYDIRSFGDQVWMIENLKSEVYPDGTPIAFGLYNPGNNIANVEKRGYLYSWSAAIKQPQIYDTIMLDVSGQRVQGVCPTNWHLPTVEEWTTLIDLYGGIAVAGLKLKIANPGYWSEPVEIEEPLSGFNAIPAGMRHADGWYNSELDHAMYWTTTQHLMGGNIMGRNVNIMSFYPNITLYHTNTNNVPGSFGLSVRCIRD